MFEGNLARLKNPRLRNSLLRIPITDCTKDIAFVANESGNVIFLKGDLPTDDTINPIGYAQSLITSKMKEFTKNDIIVCVGIGVGYILDELFSSTKAKIVIYEPDSKFLRFVFETVDLTQYLSDSRVFISDDMFECADYILREYIDDRIEFVMSPILALFYKSEIEDFTNYLYTRLKKKIVDVNTVKTLAKYWVNNVINFIKSDRKFYSIQDYRWKFSQKTALILGAGPSLADNIEKIKAMREKFVIFAVNKTLKFLEDNDVVPDFAVFADAKNIGKNYNLSEEYTSKLNVIADWKTESFVSDLKTKSLTVYFSDNELFLNKYAKDLDISLFSAESTTTLISLMCAHYMDFEKIYFCGFDLALKGNQAYSDGEVVQFNNNKAYISNSRKHLVDVPSVTGDFVKTREDYSIFIKNVETIIKTRGMKNLYNITDFGALIEGMNYTSFDNINIYGQKPDVDAVIAQLPICNKDFRKYVELEKKAMINIHQDIIGRSPINMITKKIISDASLLYEYLQMEILDLSRNSGQSSVIDAFYSKSILALDNLLAIMG